MEKYIDKLMKYKFVDKEFKRRYYDANFVDPRIKGLVKLHTEVKIPIINGKTIHIIGYLKVLLENWMDWRVGIYMMKKCTEI